jgi:hypothetical protein
MEDIKIGRRGRHSNGNAVVGNAASVLLVPQDPDRTALIISAPSAGYITVSTDPTAVLDKGINLYALQYPLELSLEQHGAIVRQAFSAIASAGTPTIGYLASSLAEH